MRAIWTVAVGASCLLVVLASLCLIEAHSQLSGSSGSAIIRGDILHKRSLNTKNPSAINYDQFLSRRTSGARALKSPRKLRKSSGARALSTGARRRFRGSRARSMGHHQRRLVKRFSNQDDEFLAMSDAYADDGEFLDSSRAAHDQPKSQARAAIGDILPAVSLQPQAQQQQQQQQQEGGACKCAEQQQQQQSVEVPKVGGNLAEGVGQLASGAKLASLPVIPKTTTNQQQQQQQQQQQALQIPVIGGGAQLPVVEQQQQQQQQQSAGSDEALKVAGVKLPEALKLGKVDGARGSSPLDSLKHAVEKPKVASPASEQQQAQASVNTPSLFAATPSNLAGQAQKLVGGAEQKQQQVELGPVGGIKLQDQAQRLKPALGESVEDAVEEAQAQVEPEQEQQQQQVELGPLGGIKLQDQQQERSGDGSGQQKQQQLDLGPLGGIKLQDQQQEQQQGKGSAGGQQQQQQTEVGPAGVKLQEQQQQQEKKVEVPKLVIREPVGRTQSGGALKKIFQQKEVTPKLKSTVNALEAKSPLASESTHEPEPEVHSHLPPAHPQPAHLAHHKHAHALHQHHAHQFQQSQHHHNLAKFQHHVAPHAPKHAGGVPFGHQQQQQQHETPHCTSALYELKDVIGEVLALIEHVGQHVLNDESVDYLARDALSRKLAKIRAAADESRMAATLAQYKRLNESARVAGVELLRLANGPAVQKVEPSVRPLALKMRSYYVAYRKACKPASTGSAHQ